MTDDRHPGLRDDPQVAADRDWLLSALAAEEPKTGMVLAEGAVLRMLDEAIAATDHPTGSPPAVRRRPRWRLGALAGTIAAGIAAIVLGLCLVLVAPHRPVYAATPTALPITAAPAGRPAPTLRNLATAAEHTALPGAGPVDHLVIDQWHLDSRIDDHGVASAVFASRYEAWRAGDDSGRIRDTPLPPQFPTSADRDAWQDAGSPQNGDHRDDPYGPHEFPTAFSRDPADRFPVDPTQLDAWLILKGSGPSDVLTAGTDLLRERALTAAQRAALLRTLADRTALAYAGSTVDRAGRPGLVFTMTTTDSGGQITHEVVIDARTGAVLAYEQILTAGAPALPVHRPAVISYNTYLQADHVPKIG